MDVSIGKCGLMVGHGGLDVCLELGGGCVGGWGGIPRCEAFLLYVRPSVSPYVAHFNSWVYVRGSAPVIFDRTCRRSSPAIC